MLSVSFATIVETMNIGNFTNDTASVNCNEENVQAVYLCSGNVVRVLSSVPGEGSIFYKPNGKVVHCPDVTPSQMGAECVQMMVPNYCSVQFVCPEETVPVEGPDNTTLTVLVAPPPKVVQPQSPTVNKKEFDLSRPPSQTEPESFLGNLVVLIFFLGVISVAVLFSMFKNSLAEE